MPSRKNQDALALFFFLYGGEEMISWEQLFDILYQSFSLPNKKST